MTSLPQALLPHHEGDDPPPVPVMLFRGGGSSGKKKHAQPQKSSQPHVKGGPKAAVPNKPPKTEGTTEQAATSAVPVAKKPAGASSPAPPLEDGLLCPEHWDAPVRTHSQMQHGLESVCLASKDTYLTKRTVLNGAPGKVAMLVAPTVETDRDCALIMVWVRIGDTTRQVARKFVQLGTTPVMYNPPAARGKAPVVTPMATLVLELPKRVFPQEKEWKQAVTDACATFTTFVQKEAAGTEWADFKIHRCHPRVNNGHTTAIEAFARVPLSLFPALLKQSGVNDRRVFARPFLDKTATPTSDPQYRNLWLHAASLPEAIKKYETLPTAKTFGMAWNAKDFAVRVSATDAAELAPLATGRPYVDGDRYEIIGVPRDWQANALFAALSATDCPWPRIQDAMLISRKPHHGAFTWVIKAHDPPPAVIVFLDEYVLSIKKFEPRAAPIRPRKEVPMPTASAWTTPPAESEPTAPLRPAPEANAQRPNPRQPLGEQPEDGRERSRSPRRPADMETDDLEDNPMHASANAAEMAALQGQVTQMQAAMIALTAQLTQLTAAVAALTTRVDQ